MPRRRKPVNRHKRWRRVKWFLPYTLRQFLLSHPSEFKDFLDGLTLPEDLPEISDEFKGLDPRAKEKLSRECKAADMYVAYIIELMSRGLWNHRTHPEILASKLGLSKSRIQNLSAEAGRHLRMYRGEDGTLALEEASKRLMRLSERCEQLHDEALKSGDRDRIKTAHFYMGHAVNSAKAFNDAAAPPKKQQIDVVHELKALPESELTKRKNELLARIAAKMSPSERAKLLAQQNIPDADFTENVPADIPEAPTTRPILDDESTSDNDDD